MLHYSRVAVRSCFRGLLSIQITEQVAYAKSVPMPRLCKIRAKLKGRVAGDRRDYRNVRLSKARLSRWRIEKV